MYDELVKRLRNHAGVFIGFVNEDLLAAADAIEELQKLLDGVSADNDNLCKQLDDMNEANIALYGALPKWIPVTERLPETPGEYMVAYHPCYWDRVHDEIKVGLDSFRGKTSWARKKYQRVTHWMPLPEPPKEET